MLAAAMKMHRILAEAAAAICTGVLDGRRVLDRELAAAFEGHPKWGRRDRAFVAETVFEVVRWRRALAFVADCDAVAALCAVQWLRMGMEIPAWWHHGGAPPAEMAVREAALASQPRAVRESIPDWLDDLAATELGAAWDAEIAALNRRAPVFLRVNTLPGDRAEAREWLAAAGVEAGEVPGMPDALVLPPGKSLPKLLLAAGRVEIQDAGSQMIAPLLDPQPGECVIDACAGAGGKTLHLAALMRNDGRIFAMDVVAPKLAELTRRAKRAGAGCIRTIPLAAATPRDFAGRADRLLIDAPCSGLGTLRRQPDLKWRLTPARLRELRALQRDLLATYPAMLKPGGRLVYATCSILPSENRAAVESLLERGGFTLLEEREISPAARGFDGFYAAALRKEPAAV
jgi:16S rRNA (cytosine967-C5)-methyltransferase